MTLSKNSELGISASCKNYWKDEMIHDFYVNYYKNLSSRELDQEFNKDFEKLTKILSKLPESKRKSLIEVLTRFIQFYLDTKIEKEVENYLLKILK